MPRKITATAPCRVDLAGGTLDIWPLYLFHPGAVTVNYALTVRTRCSIAEHTGSDIVLRSIDTAREDRFANIAELKQANQLSHGLAGYLLRQFLRLSEYSGRGFTVETDSHSPAGAGISGSSALMIASTAAMAKFFGVEMDKEQMRVLAQNVEAQLIRVPTGCQDYYPALYGGVGAVKLLPSGIERVSIDVPAQELSARMVLVYTGAPRQSGINNWEVFKAHIEGDQRVFQNFEEIADIAKSMFCALTGREWSKVAMLMQREWKLRKTNAPGITTPMIDKLVEKATAKGAVAAKVCGAGGGGCVAIMVEPQAKQRVEAAMAAAGATVLNASVDPDGILIATE